MSIAVINLPSLFFSQEGSHTRNSLLFLGNCVGFDALGADWYAFRGFWIFEFIRQLLAHCVGRGPASTHSEQDFGHTRCVSRSGLHCRQNKATIQRLRRSELASRSFYFAKNSTH